MAVPLIPSSAEIQVEAAREVGVVDPLSRFPGPGALESQSSGLLGYMGVTKDPNQMVVSPYREEPHLLDLHTLDTPNRLLAQALAKMMCLRKDYATAPYERSFNWSEIMGRLHDLAQEEGYEWTEQAFYVVVFRSRILPHTNRAVLGILDKAAHAEAMESGGFLKYWYGCPDEDGRNLATCVWRSCIDARTGSIGPQHLRAAKAARNSYSEWGIQRLRLLIKDDAEGWEISKWVD